MANAYRTLEGLIVETTEDAVLLQDPAGEEFWIPRSVCDGGADLDEGDDDPQVAVWWLNKEGFE